MDDLLEDSSLEGRVRVPTNILDVWSSYWTLTIRKLLEKRKQVGEVQYIAKVALRQLEVVLAKVLPEIQKENQRKDTNKVKPFCKNRLVKKTLSIPE